MKLRTDLCWQCQQNSTATARTSNSAKADKTTAINDALKHLWVMKTELGHIYIYYIYTHTRSERANSLYTVHCLMSAFKGVCINIRKIRLANVMLNSNLPVTFAHVQLIFNPIQCTTCTPCFWCVSYNRNNVHFLPGTATYIYMYSMRRK